MAVSPDAGPAGLSARPVAGGIHSFRNAHRWLFVALLIILLGFARSYFSRLGDATWQQHLHGISATAWFVLLIVQPYLATHGRLSLHRVIGPMGLILAGMVVASALGTIPGNIENAQRTDLPSLVSPVFFYGISFFDLVISSGFTISVVMAMLRVRVPREHAIWMVSTVFWVLSPGLIRLLVTVRAIAFGIEGWTFIEMAMIATLPVTATIGFIMYRLRQAHPALILVLFGNLSVLLVPWLGNNETWRSIAESVFM